jgi:tetratricopeptide (TPR) repeat protein
MLDAAWSGEGAGAGVQIVTLIAPGGVGKTALIKRWLDRLKLDGWRGADSVFGWSFYSQGTNDDRQATDEFFLSTALALFGVAHDPAASPWDKGRLLAQTVAARRTLLVLDGCEPLQYPPGQLAGQLRAPGLKALLAQLAGAGQPGLTLLTSREAVADLAEYARGPEYPQGAVLTHDLGNLTNTDGARLLHRLGCIRAGAVTIEPDDNELRAVCHEVRGHALTLNLLGRYLAQAEGGDCRRRDTVDLMDAADKHVFRVLAAYETWFERAGATVELAALRLLGFFDRPADAGCIQALRQAPPIPGLTEPLFVCTKSLFGLHRRYEPIADSKWRQALTRLAECGLIERLGGLPREAGVDHSQHWNLAQSTRGLTDAMTIDVHPLIRKYLDTRLRNSTPSAWREGHRRLYNHLESSTPRRPEALSGLQPLYQAVAHGCLAGLQQQACVELYRDRIMRGTGPDGFYSPNKIGAFGADLCAVACFFDQPWQQISTALAESDRAWILNEAALSLRALGRTTEALEPMQVALEVVVRTKNWKNASRGTMNLSELKLTLGLVSDAIKDGKRSVEYADLNGNSSERFSTRTALADALHQQGQRAPSLEAFREAESMCAKYNPQHLLLSGAGGFHYCDLLLADPERAAWQVFLALTQEEAGVSSIGSTEPLDHAATASSPELVRSAAGENPTSTLADSTAPLGLVLPPNLSVKCKAVAERAMKTLELDKNARFSPLAIALNHLTIGRATLILTLLEPADPGRPAFERSAREIAIAVDRLRASGRQDYIPLGLFSRAWLNNLLQDTAAARIDLDEVWQIASRSEMRLFMADCHLHRARILRDRKELVRARALIEQCGYWRRREELEDAERAAQNWPIAP